MSSGDGSEEGCHANWCFFHQRQQQQEEDDERDLDGFLGFIHRKEPSSNPALKGDLSGTTALPVSRAESKQGTKSHSTREASVSRDEKVTNMHVIESIYFNSVGTPVADASAFKGIRTNLARGTSAQIHLLQHIASGYLGVMKVFPPNRQFQAKAELNALAECSESPFILQVIDAFASERVSHIFLEYAPFRTLDELTQVTDGLGSENCALFALEILLAIQHMHQLKILHRDIKPENVFLLISGHIKVGDFSEATFLDPRTNRTRGLCCTYVTRPPEVWNYDYYSYPVDIWAFGITIYNIITNTWPIMHASQERQIEHVNRGDLIFSTVFTPAAADLITRAVQPKPEDRWTVAQLISHNYFHSLRDPFPAPYSPTELLEMYSYNSSVLEDLTFLQDMVAHLP